MIKEQVTINCGHPWGRYKNGWDGLDLSADTVLELECHIEACKQDFWQVWICGQRIISGACKPAAYLYRPTGAMKSWIDSIDSGAATLAKSSVKCHA